MRAHVAHPVTMNGVAAIPRGNPVAGVVTEAIRPGRVDDQARLAVRFDSVAPKGGQPLAIKTTAVGR